MFQIDFIIILVKEDDNRISHAVLGATDNIIILSNLSHVDSFATNTTESCINQIFSGRLKASCPLRVVFSQLEDDLHADRFLTNKVALTLRDHSNASHHSPWLA